MYNPNTKRYSLCLNEKLEIAKYKGHNLLNKQSEIIDKVTTETNLCQLFMTARTEFSFLLKLLNNHSQGITAFQNLIVSRVCEFNQVLGINVFLCWLAYLAAMHMKSQFPHAWLAHSSCEINQIMGGSDPLCWLNFENCESEPYINHIILKTPLYCKVFDNRTWLKVVHPMA